LGFAGYYRRFLPDFSKTARLLTNLLKKDTKFEWTDTQELAFSSLKNSLCSEPLLQYPDFTQPFLVTTDASKYAIGGILSQGEIGKDPIAYTSRLLNAAEQNYFTIEKELLAIVYSVNYFRPYLYGHKFSLVTDHRPLVWLESLKDSTSRLVRWRLKLAEYEYKIIYKAGKINLNADALSRNPKRSRIFRAKIYRKKHATVINLCLLSHAIKPEPLTLTLNRLRSYSQKTSPLKIPATFQNPYFPLRTTKYRTIRISK